MSIYFSKLESEPISTEAIDKCPKQGNSLLKKIKMQLCLLYGKLFMSRDEGVRCWSSTESEDFAKGLTDYPFKIFVFSTNAQAIMEVPLIATRNNLPFSSRVISFQPLEPLLCISKISHAYPTLFFPFIVISISSYSSTVAIN